MIKENDIDDTDSCGILRKGGVAMYFIADLLKSTDISGIRLRAGGGGVEKEIFRTNIMDNPDTMDWLAPGELMLSTGYVFKDSEETQRNIICQLAEVGCSGLAIKTMRYLPSVPQCMIEEADRLNFPLIELPYGHSLSDVASIVNKHLFRYEESRLEQAFTIHRELTRAALQSGGLREIAKIATGYLNNPVLIFDSNWRLLRWEDSPQNPYPLEQSFTLKRKEEVLPKDFTDSMPEKLDMFRKSITRLLPLKNGHQILCRIMPVGTADTWLYGYILVWETVHTFSKADYLMLEQVSVSVAMERLRSRELEEVRFRVKRDFFDDLLSGNMESLSAMRSLAEIHGLNLSSHYRCVLVRYMSGIPEDKLLRQSQLSDDAKQCASICNRVAQDAGFVVITIPYSFQTILLLEVPKHREEEKPDVRQFAQSLFDALGGIFDSNHLTVVVGTPASDITGIAKTFTDVQQTARMLQETTGQSPVAFVDDYTFFHLLTNNIDREHLASFAKKSLGKLIQYDQENGTQLIQTLDAYFQFSGNISEAAKCMYIHRNTYIYRLDKIKHILNDSFDNSQKLLEYQAALLAMRIC